MAIAGKSIMEIDVHQRKPRHRQAVTDIASKSAKGGPCIFYDDGNQSLGCCAETHVTSTIVQEHSDKRGSRNSTVPKYV